MKKRLIRSAVPVYLAALVWILFGLLLPMYKLSSILLAAGVSVAAWLLAGRFFPGRVVEEEEAPNSGDAEVNKQILEGRENLKSLKDSAASISDETVTAPLSQPSARESWKAPRLAWFPLTPDASRQSSYTLPSMSYMPQSFALFDPTAAVLWPELLEITA